MKKICFAVLLLLAVLGCIACKPKAEAPHVDGTLEELMQRVYDNSGLTELPALVNTVITDENKAYFLGSSDIPMAEGLASEPAINAIAHSVCLIRLPEGADAASVKRMLLENANPRKWICVCVDDNDVVADSIGDLVILIMADESDALHKSFLSLGGGQKTTEAEIAGSSAKSIDISPAIAENGVDTNTSAGQAVSGADTKRSDTLETKNPVATITMEDGGVITIELRSDVAPNTVKNFTALANEGFYDGVIFHRVISGFMIQGGDPTGTGRGGPDYCIKGEFANNGVKNDLSHARGVVSMARQGNPYMPASAYDTAGSQFFIMHADGKFLDGDYAAFGVVTSGMDVVDRIAAAETGEADRPYTDQIMQTVRVETFGQDLGEPEKCSGRK